MDFKSSGVLQGLELFVDFELVKFQSSTKHISAVCTQNYETETKLSYSYTIVRKNSGTISTVVGKLGIGALYWYP
jgi:hypothetical protein